MNNKERGADITVLGPARPLFLSRVSAGFPSPADDHLEGELDLNERYVLRPAATFFMRAKGDAMNGAGIFEGDILIVDRSIQAENGRVVILDLAGELVVRRVEIKAGGGCTLCAENPNYRPIIVQELMVWGVVTAVIHCL